jgi:coenzyme F420-reducing hydrogenase delta subunit/Pyruvate/2-oxoacid:ferredoxin oxidoreductase delta subunit
LEGIVLEQLGFDKKTLKVIKYSRKAVYETDKCVGCDKCVFICPYSAIEAEPFSTPKILQDKCVGCGACALICPHHAIQIKGFEFEEVLKRYEGAARKMKKESEFPLILIFCCQWSEFSALDDPNMLLKKNELLFEIPCFKALDPVHIINALQNGFDGVMAVVCSEDDCKLQEGRETTERNMTVLKDVLRKKNLLERFNIFEVSPRFKDSFKEKLDEFSKKIDKLSSRKEEAKMHV